MLGISRRGEGAHVICACLNVPILSGRQCVIDFFGFVWKLDRVRQRWGLPSLTPSNSSHSADRQVKATTQPN